jgi:endonuclease YncB( thermonuclease family)
VSTVKPDKYADRVDAVITLPDGHDLAQLLCATGWAAAWNGHGTKPAPDWPRPV